MYEYFGTEFEKFTLNDFNDILNNDRRYMRDLLGR